MTNGKAWAVEDGWQCQQQLAKLCYLLDHDGLAEIDAMFTADPVVELFGTIVSGIEPIRELFGERTRGKVIRHAASPAAFFPVDDGSEQAWASSYVTVYREDQSDEPGPRPLNGPVNVVEYRDLFVRQHDGWRIAKRQISMIFLKKS